MKIGSGAYIGPGSVITKDVFDNAMRSSAAPQTNREGEATRYRELKTGGKPRKSGE